MKIESIYYGCIPNLYDLNVNLYYYVKVLTNL